MKKVLFFVILMLRYFAQADCSSSGLNFYPSSFTVSENSWFFIEGYALDQKTVKAIDTDYIVKLISKTDTIALEKITTHNSMMYLTIVSLQPKSNLKKDVTYTLKLIGQNGEKDIDPTRYEGNACDWLPVMYKATKSADNNAPVWVEKPKFDQTYYTAFGCGPAIYANFNATIEDDSEIMVLIEIINSSEENTNTYPIKLVNKTIQIGHGMCSGAFKFKKDVTYQARFMLIDASGNRTKNWTAWYSFDNPTAMGPDN